MPIRAENRWLYPIDWRQLSDAIRFGRANARCERCGRPHRRRVAHLGDGRWWDAESLSWRSPRGRRIAVRERAVLAAARTTYVVLACAHLDHDPGNNAPANLAALCQRCHMLNDAAEHRRQRWWNAFRRRALRDLFEGTAYCGSIGPARSADRARRARDAWQAKRSPPDRPSIVTARSDEPALPWHGGVAAP